MRERATHRLNRRGISVVELLVGITLLAVVVISLAAASLYASRTMRRSRVQLEAAEFQQAELERLLAVSYGSLASGSRTTSRGTAKWTVLDSASYRRILLVTEFTPASAISLSDTVVAYRLRP